MNIRNMDGSPNKEGPIEHIIEVNIYFKEHRERMEIDVIGGQKWTVILGIPWLACHNSKINWKTGEVKMTRCLEECRKQWRPKQEKVYLLLREEREEVRKFIKEQLRKGYIQLSKSLQIVPVFFVGKKDGKKQMV